MAANRSICQTCDALCHLLEILKSHADVKPVQHMLCVRSQLAMKGAQAASPSVRTVKEVFSVIPWRRNARPAALAASEPPWRTKANRVAAPCSSSTLPATISKFRSGRRCRSRTYPPSKPRTASSQEELTERLARTDADFLSRLPTFMVRLRTVLTLVSADNGSSSLKNSVALANGNKASNSKRRLHHGLRNRILQGDKQRRVKSPRRGPRP